MIRSIIIFLLMISLAYCSYSQSEFIRRGRCGIAGNAGISLNDNKLMSGIFHAGFSYYGFLDLGLTYQRANEKNINEEIFTPEIVYYPIKQEDGQKIPTLGISLGYNHYKSNSISYFAVPGPDMEHRMDTIKKDYTIDAVRLGVTAQRRIINWKGAFFQPMIGTGIYIIGTSLEFVIRGSCAIGTRLRGWPLLLLIPAVEYQSNLTTFSLTFEIVS